MPYITISRAPKMVQVSFNDILNGIDPSRLVVGRDTKDTMTWYAKSIRPETNRSIKFPVMEAALKSFVEKYKTLIDEPDKSKYYNHFTIPKRDGGRRKIDAPNAELSAALYELKNILEMKFYATYHTCAFAYIGGRNTIDSVRRHQQNKSRWFLKLDFSKFFPSTTPKFLMSMICDTYPISEFIKWRDDRKELLERALSLCFLDGGLPQGTPTSPMLTNMMMIPIDHAINKMCHEHAPHLCYTRYADDILISSEYSFTWSEVQNSIVDILKKFNAPFQLNVSKTRYGSSAGRNWNLGVMLNKDNEITIGHEKKKKFKAAIYQFLTDYADGKPWSVGDTQHLNGIASYYKMVEKRNIEKIIKDYSNNMKIDFEAAVKSILST